MLDHGELQLYMQLFDLLPFRRCTALQAAIIKLYRLETEAQQSTPLAVFGLLLKSLAGNLIVDDPIGFCRGQPIRYMLMGG